MRKRARQEGGGSHDITGAEVMVRRSSIASCVTCGLCGCLLRNATTISECLHSFCRECIVDEIKHKNINHCPMCGIDLCDPLSKLRRDHNLEHISLVIFPAKMSSMEEAAPELTSLTETLTMPGRPAALLSPSSTSSGAAAVPGSHYAAMLRLSRHGSQSAVPLSQTPVVIREGAGAAAWVIPQATSEDTKASKRMAPKSPEVTVHPSLSLPRDQPGASLSFKGMGLADFSVRPKARQACTAASAVFSCGGLIADLAQVPAERLVRMQETLAWQMVLVSQAAMDQYVWDMTKAHSEAGAEGLQAHELAVASAAKVALGSAAVVEDRCKNGLDALAQAQQDLAVEKSLHKGSDQTAQEARAHIASHDAAHQQAEDRCKNALNALARAQQDLAVERSLREGSNRAAQEAQAHIASYDMARQQVEDRCKNALDALAQAQQDLAVERSLREGSDRAAQEAQAQIASHEAARQQAEEKLEAARLAAHQTQSLLEEARSQLALETSSREQVEKAAEEAHRLADDRQLEVTKLKLSMLGLVATIRDADASAMNVACKIRAALVGIGGVVTALPTESMPLSSKMAWVVDVSQAVDKVVRAHVMWSVWVVLRCAVGVLRRQGCTHLHSLERPDIVDAKEAAENLTPGREVGNTVKGFYDKVWKVFGVGATLRAMADAITRQGPRPAKV